MFIENSDGVSVESEVMKNLVNGITILYPNYITAKHIYVQYNVYIREHIYMRSVTFH